MLGNLPKNCQNKSIPPPILSSVLQVIVHCPSDRALSLVCCGFYLLVYINNAYYIVHYTCYLVPLMIELLSLCTSVKGASYCKHYGIVLLQKGLYKLTEGAIHDEKYDYFYFCIYKVKQIIKPRIK